jgi:hypothetical protein
MELMTNFENVHKPQSAIPHSQPDAPLAQQKAPISSEKESVQSFPPVNKFGFCTNCGNNLEQGYKFCGSCGTINEDYKKT